MTHAFHIAFLPYRNMTQLDMTGPAQVLARMPGARLHFAAKTLDPVYDDVGLGFVPTTTPGRLSAARHDLRAGRLWLRGGPCGMKRCSPGCGNGRGRCAI